MQDTKDKALESVTKIKKEQVPSKDETTKEMLYGDDDEYTTVCFIALFRSNYVWDLIIMSIYKNET
jgi:hypothetical protein